MEWTAPTYAEIKMDAEIGSYQEDYEPTRESPIVAQQQQWQGAQSEAPAAA